MYYLDRYMEAMRERAAVSKRAKEPIKRGRVPEEQPPPPPPCLAS